MEGYIEGGASGISRTYLITHLRVCYGVELPTDQLHEEIYAYIHRSTFRISDL